MTQKYNVFYIEHDTASGDSWIGYITGISQVTGYYEYTDYKRLARDHKAPKAYDLKTAQAILKRITTEIGDYAGIAPAIIPQATGSPEFLED